MLEHSSRSGAFLFLVGMSRQTNIRIAFNLGWFKIVPQNCVPNNLMSCYVSKSYYCEYQYAAHVSQERLRLHTKCRGGITDAIAVTPLEYSENVTSALLRNCGTDFTSMYGDIGLQTALYCNTFCGCRVSSNQCTESHMGRSGLAKSILLAGCGASCKESSSCPGV